MTTSKKSKPANDSTGDTPFVSILWEGCWGLADDTRGELHRQVAALISLVDNSLQGLAAYAANLNDRSDRIARAGVIAGEKAGRALTGKGLEAGRTIVARYRSGATQLVTSTVDSARGISDRASATARVMVAPSKDRKAA